MNKEQNYYIQTAFKFSALWIGLLLIVSLFERTRSSIGLVITTLVAMWCVTLIHIWLFKDTKKTNIGG